MDLKLGKLSCKEQMLLCIQCHSLPLGHLNTNVVHMSDQRNTQKKMIVFYDTEQDSRELQLGVRMCLFSRKKGPFLKLF